MNKTEVEEKQQEVEAVTEAVTEESVFVNKIASMTSQLDEFCKTVKLFTNELKNMKKDYLKLSKKNATLEKTKGRKKKSRDPNAEKSTGGFGKPIQVSEKLSKFLKLGEGELIARPSVTKFLSTYIKENGLQRESNGQHIDMTHDGGEALAELLDIPRDTDLTYFTLQTHLKPHFPPSKKVEKAKEAVVESEVVKEVVKAVKAVKEASVEVDEKPRRRRRVEETTPK
jgi:hypothetical protein